MSTATQPQIEANRRNAQHSTGPRTPEGKAASSANATKFGLFATHLYVRPNEAEAYEAMRGTLLNNLRPHGAFEESLALRIINANWRMQRCDQAEAAIPVLPDQFDSEGGIHDFAHPAQKAIDRARAAAENTIRRTTKDLKELQAERWQRASLKLTGPIEPDALGLAPIKQAMADVPTDSERSHLLVRGRMMPIERPYPFEHNSPRNPSLARPVPIGQAA